MHTIPDIAMLKIPPASNLPAGLGIQKILHNFQQVKKISPKRAKWHD
jgi:hypothetical protein